MEFNEQKKPTGIKVAAILHIIINSFLGISYLFCLSNLEQANKYLKQESLPTLTKEDLISELVVCLIILIAAILLLALKSKVSVFIYFLVEIGQIGLSCILNGFDIISLVIYLILPIVVLVSFTKNKEYYSN